MTSKPAVILHTQNGAAAKKTVETSHPDLSVHVCESYTRLPELISDTGAEVVYSVRFAGSDSFPKKALVQSDTVKWVSIGGSGTDHLGQWDADWLTVTNAAGVAADMMAEYVLGMMLAFSLDLRGFMRAQAAHEWGKGKVTPIKGRTALILGLGHTGQAVAARCKAMGMNVLGVRAQPKDTEHVDQVYGMADLPDLWNRADYVIVCVPLLDSTRGLVNRQALHAMKPETVLIDVSRGGVVEEGSLIEALTSRSISGAGLDVFASEPLPQDHPLWNLSNVAITPHCSSVFEGWEMSSVEMFTKNLARYRQGRPLRNIVNPKRGY
ncbi:MAG: D-2-hydroxyacid dehydrogenase [Paracoccaceae bacterium]